MSNIDVAAGVAGREAPGPEGLGGRPGPFQERKISSGPRP